MLDITLFLGNKISYWVFSAIPDSRAVENLKNINLPYITL